MSDRKFAKASRTLLKQVWKLPRALTKALIVWLLRFGLIVNRRRNPLKSAGFVLPTTVMLLLVVTLTVGALVFRAYNRTTQVIGESQQRVIYNAATPAIDRARAKLETMFDPNQDNRYPGGVPAETYLAGMLRNDGSYSVGALAGSDQYTLPDETRINLDDRTKPNETRGEDNAWAFRTDTNGDGNSDATVVYSIIFQTPQDLNDASGNPVAGSGVVDETDSEKAENLLARTAPLSNRQRGNCGVTNTQVSSAAQGWFQDLASTSILRKNFQVDALVIPDNAANRNNFTTLEMQHDRELNRGNKWGAWFRYDMEIYPGPLFNWNGAMHTEGSFMAQPGDGFNAYLVSAANSCLMSSASNSEISITRINLENDPTKPPSFVGATLSSSMRDNGAPGSYPINIHVFPAGDTGPSDIEQLDAATGSANASATPGNVGLDPVALLTRDVSIARGGDQSNRSNVVPSTLDDNNPWRLPQSSPLDSARISNKPEAKPYVDDLYRADNRWGPKPVYDQIKLNDPTQQPGRRITTASVAQPADYNTLVGNDPIDPTLDTSKVGLDGYWERRARYEGMRVIVGQRLELGNTFGWTNSDSLYPPNQDVDNPPPPPDDFINHQQRQRRSLRDNLAAVQATAVYYTVDPASTTEAKDFPKACLASTVHPGTAETLRNSITFDTRSDSPNFPVIDFFTGRGTNGWEFAPPQGDETTFGNAINNLSSPLRIALENLAYFAGDVNGAFPPTPDSRIHPYPLLSMWGNFSELRRTLAEGGAYGPNLSPADKTNFQTAACTLGMLAYSVETFQNYTTTRLAALDAAIGTAPSSPEAALAAVKLVDPTLESTALAVFNKYQIARDRQYGFADGEAPAAQCLGATGSNIDRAFCRDKPRYPALYYIFPTENHGQVGGSGGSPPQPPAEPYIGDTSATSPAKYVRDTNTSVTYKIVDLSRVRVEPKQVNFSNWVLPNLTPSTLSTNPNRIRVGNTANPPERAVGFLDRAIFNGREMMTTRVMDIDLGMLRSQGSTATGNKPWLPISGIVYGFREDAVREDAIMRPSGGSQTDATDASPTDPALVTTPQNISVSTKQVDYIADPDRRPHGFRLRNGSQIKRNASFGIPDTDNVRGLSFISDNPVTIQGNFNLHQTGGDDSVGTRLEEFTQQLVPGSGPGGTYTESQFYGRTTRDTNFAQPNQDRWRPSEILADAVSILSDNFCDGSIEDAFVVSGPTNSSSDGVPNAATKYNGNGLFGPGCRDGQPTSFLDQNRPEPTPAAVAWVRENSEEKPAAATNNDDPEFTSPIKIDRNGRPLTDPAGTPTLYRNTPTAYEQFIDDKPLMPASDTTVYSIIVSGIVPSRPGQGYGGLHNFPRFLENWRGRNLWFNGSFLQLNFSNYATAPLEQDAWEPGDPPIPGTGTGEPIKYYLAPNRVWGYDTALQLAPASPAAARFVLLNKVRNEFYTELPVSDPYIRGLCEAFKQAPRSGALSGAPNNVNCPGA